MTGYCAGNLTLAVVFLDHQPLFVIESSSQVMMVSSGVLDTIKPDKIPNSFELFSISLYSFHS